MRRKEKEIADKSDLDAIIRKAAVCRLAMSDGIQPYVVPLCFGYKDGTLYMHTAREGMKLDILKKNSRVCFEMDIDLDIVPGDRACDWGMHFRSVIGFGTALVIQDPSQKRNALDSIMAHYSEAASHEYPEKIIDKIVIIKVDIESMTGKKSGY